LNQIINMLEQLESLTVQDVTMERPWLLDSERYPVSVICLQPEKRREITLRKMAVQSELYKLEKEYGLRN
jgi:hypothetical protein